jgi:hypothetical protein
MTEELGDRAEALFYEAIDLPPEEQRALLQTACDGDLGLLPQVEKLLADARLRTGKDTVGFQSWKGHCRSISRRSRTTA